ncbi:MAG: helix-turn-helix domain-containing protein [Betaproteobacteria bacterium]|nr:MAG: helix-turn-helix domain-containing protein [Betaproteobacteria bacterium]
MNTKELETWEKGRDLEAELLASIGHIESGQYQELKTVQVPYPTAVRLKLGVSQSEFARLLCVPKRTIQEWEQERRKPTGAAMALLRVVESAPEIVKGILAKSDDLTSSCAA